MARGGIKHVRCPYMAHMPGHQNATLIGGIGFFTRRLVYGLAALQPLDAVAGGDPTKIIRLGDRRINRAIASQWKGRV